MRELSVGGESVVPSVGVAGGSGHPTCRKGKETHFESIRSCARPWSPSPEVGECSPGALAHSGCERGGQDPACAARVSPHPSGSCVPDPSCPSCPPLLTCPTLRGSPQASDCPPAAPLLTPPRAGPAVRPCWPIPDVWGQRGGQCFWANGRVVCALGRRLRLPRGLGCVIRREA